jgi:hypothetical protein
MCLAAYVMQLLKTSEESRGKRFFEVIVEACVNRWYNGTMLLQNNHWIGTIDIDQQYVELF